MDSVRSLEPVRIGIDIIDEQHAVILGMLGDLEDAVAAGARTGAVVTILADLHQYAQIHFETEESLLERYVPGRVEGHREDHRVLLDRLRDVVLRYKQEGGAVPDSLLGFLRSFVLGHLGEADVEDLRIVRERLREERTSLLVDDA